MEVVTIFFYWGGTTCDGPDGISYNKAPKKAIKVNQGIQFDELVDRVYHATSFDKQQHHLNLTCRYPSVGVGNVIKYIPLPINDDDDVGIMFDVLRVHQEVSNLDLYLEVEDNGPIRHTEMAPRNHEFVVLEEERSSGLLTTNLSEIFNSVLKGARFLPITACAQLTFYRMVNYFEVRRPLGSSAQANGDEYTPHVRVIQVALMSKASAHFLRSFNRDKGIFELLTQRGKNVQVVNLEQKTCTCGKWEAFKYPCSHVLGACAQLSLNSWQYVDKCYSIEEYCATWLSEFSPIPHEAYWPQSSSRKLLPNLELLRNKKGRPRSTRLKNGMDIKEGRNGYRCGICKQNGHNRKKCPSKPS